MKVAGQRWFAQLQVKTHYFSELCLTIPCYMTRALRTNCCLLQVSLNMPCHCDEKYHEVILDQNRRSIIEPVKCVVFPPNICI